MRATRVNGCPAVATTVILAASSLRDPAVDGSANAIGETTVALLLGVAAGLLVGPLRMRRQRPSEA
ncbi:hypothetical protein [Agromyces bauzanensis]|uniref:Uncharacterized protein n=1 Tax=Agromyces bauzanensis TaxID=1308924 RepID=A0A917UT50_9MICO|nr:hypothetical protein [Agromyces bauzanensis]GGJ83557.1 hypothetical protein GCM10011372_22420 [Agromyces bauzanensis]